MLKQFPQPQEPFYKDEKMGIVSENWMKHLQKRFEIIFSFFFSEFFISF